MPKAPKGDPRTVEYWDERVKSAKNDDDMLFIDGRREEYWRRVADQLALWKDLRVLDVACGFGHFAGIFQTNLYDGIDFSGEMIALANRKHPSYRFKRIDIHQDEPYDGDWDVIFEVNSLRSLGMTADDFIKKYAKNARMAVATLEADEFRIAELYPQRGR